MWYAFLAGRTSTDFRHGVRGSNRNRLLVAFWRAGRWLHSPELPKRLSCIYNSIICFLCDNLYVHIALVPSNPNLWKKKRFEYLVCRRILLISFVEAISPFTYCLIISSTQNYSRFYLNIIYYKIITTDLSRARQSIWWFTTIILFGKHFFSIIKNRFIFESQLCIRRYRQPTM